MMNLSKCKINDTDFYYDRKGSAAMIFEQINEKQYAFISEKDKCFIVTFTQSLEQIGYTYNDTISDGFCWGKKMMIFRKANVKSKNVVARIYIREDSIVLRLFFNHVTKHADFISKAPEHIQQPFVGEYGTCKHCKGDDCKFRKDYQINGINYEKCNGLTFEFQQPTTDKLPDYLSLFKEFYPVK